MKQVKTIMVALAVMMGISLTSCMNSEGNSGYDGAAFVTVIEGFVGVTLKSDDGITTYTPTNPELLLKNATTGEYWDRAFIYFDYPEGVTPTTGKTSYTITISGGQGVLTSGVSLRPDTLKNAYPISEFSIWGSQYHLNTGCSVNCDVVPQFALYIDTANVDISKNKLPLILKYISGGNDSGGGSYSYTGYNSWNVSSIDVESLGLNIGDSVTVQVTANENSSPKVRTIKYKFDY